MKKIILTSFILAASHAALADNVINDDLIVNGSSCIGLDCTNGYNFGFDTLVLKENNLRMYFDDSSSTGSFPSNDWRFTFNDSGNGGSSFFSVDDATAGKSIFKVEAGAPANSLYVDGQGDVGVGTSTPVLELQVTDGDSPGLRLEQNGSSGWTPQTWDISGNETNFFVRDVTNGSQLPFKILPNAGNNNLVLKNGSIGIGTNAPSDTVHIKHSGDTGFRFENTTATVGSTWRVYNQGDSGKLKFTDDPTGARTPLKLEKDASNNLVKIGTTITAEGATTNSQVEIRGSLKATYLVDDNGNIYKLSDIVTALSELGKNLPTY
ncbi:hypothetical protein NBRC116188_18690 [Oceaniserpentilla sp. 4NH20-0058]|uniref:hypothetical protein n=1 Tax=Oceaniserpentilla sp. 4NH20-0058 TaxID=3127660 RepID=UPI0031037352